MGKGGPKKAKQKTAAPVAAASSSAAGGAFRSRAVGAVLLAAFAIGLQALLSSNAPSAEVPPHAPRGPPPACPADWPACPRTAGVDWAAADAAEAESDLSPAALSEGLRGCNATALLSPQRVPGMHAICILPPPAGEERAAATLVVYDSMRRAEGGREGGRVVSLLLPARLSDASHVAAAVLRRLGVRPRPRTPSGQYQPAALFTDRGVRVVSAGGRLRLGESIGSLASVHSCSFRRAGRVGGGAALPRERLRRGDGALRRRRGARAAARGRAVAVAACRGDTPPDTSQTLPSTPSSPWLDAAQRRARDVLDAS